MSDDHALAAELANLAGEHLLALREERGFADRDALREAGDESAHRLLLDELTARRGEDAVLSEHGSLGRVHDADGRCWIVDPLDGTKEFGEPGRVDWAVHVALADGRQLSAGAIALPARGLLLDTADPPLPPTGPVDRIRVVASRTRPPAFLKRLAELVDIEVIPLGSAGAKVAAVLLGEADAYLHSGGQYVWDSAAPVAVALAGRFYASRLDGRELSYRDKDPWVSDLFVARPDVAPTLRAALDSI